MDERTMLRYVDELQGQIDRLKKMVGGGGGGGTKDYDKLNNRPKVNNITLSGNKKSSDLKIAYNMTEAEYEAATKNAESIYFLQENAGTLTDSAYVNLEVADWTEVSGVYKQTKPFVFEVTPAAGWTIEDVSIETGIASVDSYEVTADPFGLSITYAAETLPEYGITATVTVTITQPAGSTRIVKNGLQFGGNEGRFAEITSGNGALSRTFTLDKTPKFVDLDWTTDGTWYYHGSFAWGAKRMFFTASDSATATTSVPVGVSTISYGSDGKSFTVTGGNAGGAINTALTSGLMYLAY